MTSALHSATALPSGPRARVSALSIRTKLALVMALGFVVSFAVSFGLVVKNERALGLQQEAASEALLIELLAGQMGGPLRFKDGERISSIYQPVVEKDTGLVMIEVVHSDGTTLATYNSSEQAAVPYDRLMGQAVAAARETLTGQTRGDGLRFATALPVLSPDGLTLLGVIALARDHGVALSAYFEQTLTALVVSALVALVGLACIVFLIARMVKRPIGALGQAMGKVSEGDYSVAIPETGRFDEIGDMADRLTVLRDTLAREVAERNAREDEAAERQKLFQRLAEHLRHLSEGEIDCPIDETEFSSLDDDHRAVCRSFNNVLSNLRDVLSTVMATAESVRNSSREISEVAADQSKRSESQAATLEESAAAIEELNASVQQTAEHAAEADKRIVENKKQAEAGGDVVGQTVAAMKSIEDSSQQITAIIGVIDDIAFQTNLLALNAGVEAARAGDAGRGFAVVASEVRALAQRASDSANEIKELIMRSSEEVTRGSDLAGKAGNALNEIIEGVNHVSELVSRIATGSREQANNLAEIKESVSNLDRVTQQNAAVIEESSAASRSLSDEAERMTDVLGSFRLDAGTARALAGPASDKAADYAGWSSEVSAANGSDTRAAEPVLAFASAAGRSRKAVNDDDGWDEF